MNNRLKECRKAVSMSRAELSQKTGLSPRTIGAIENGSRNLTESNARLIGGILGVSYSYLLMECDYPGNGIQAGMNVEIPGNMARWLRTRDGANIQVNFNSAGADSGYIHALHRSVVVSILNRSCCRCGYNTIWNPDDSESKCQRHTYGNWEYSTVFVWTPNCSESLEKCFDIWLKENKNIGITPIKKMTFGKIGW